MTTRYVFLASLLAAAAACTVPMAVLKPARINTPTTGDRFGAVLASIAAAGHTVTMQDRAAGIIQVAPRETGSATIGKQRASRTMSITVQMYADGVHLTPFVRACNSNAMAIALAGVDVQECDRTNRMSAKEVEELDSIVQRITMMIPGAVSVDGPRIPK